MSAWVDYNEKDENTWPPESRVILVKGGTDNRLIELAWRDYDMFMLNIVEQVPFKVKKWAYLPE